MHMRTAIHARACTHGIKQTHDPHACAPQYQTTNSGRRTSLDERLAGMLCGGPGAEPPAAAPAQPPAASGEPPVLEPSAMHAMAMDLLKEVCVCVGGGLAGHRAWAGREARGLALWAIMGTHGRS